MLRRLRTSTTAAPSGAASIGSTDRGATGAEVARNGCLDTIVDKVAIAPNAGAGYSIYVLGGAVIYHSGDGGASWNCPAINLQAGGLLDLALSPAFATDRTLLVATGQGLKRSTDGGASWTQAGWAGAPVQRVTFSPAYAQDRTLAVALQDGIYSATHPGGTFFSADNGATWRPADIARMPVKTIALSPAFAEDQKVWAASGTGNWKAYRSANGGETWLMQHYQAGSGDGGFNALGGCSSQQWAARLYATSPLGGPLAGVYKSVDDGASFSRLANSPQFGSAVAVTMATNGEKAVWVSNYQGVHLSLNSGVLWTLRNGDLPAGSVVSLAVAAEANTPDTALLFAVLTGAQAEVFRSADSGGHWAKLPLPGGAAAQQVALSPAYAVDQRLWVSTSTSGILRSADGGESWQEPATVLNGCGPVQVTGEGASQQLWAACGGRLYTSTDGGVQWAATGPGGLTVATVATSPLTKMVYIGTEGGDGIWRGRPDTSTVVVRDEAGAPVAGAEVYRNGALAGRTAASGVLETPLAAGDQLVARKLLKTEPSKTRLPQPRWRCGLGLPSLHHQRGNPGNRGASPCSGEQSAEDTVLDRAQRQHAHRLQPGGQRGMGRNRAVPGRAAPGLRPHLARPVRCQQRADAPRTCVDFRQQRGNRQRRRADSRPQPRLAVCVRRRAAVPAGAPGHWRPHPDRALLQRCKLWGGRVEPADSLQHVAARIRPLWAGSARFLLLLLTFPAEAVCHMHRPGNPHESDPRQQCHLDVFPPIRHGVLHAERAGRVGGAVPAHCTVPVGPPVRSGDHRCGVPRHSHTMEVEDASRLWPGSDGATCHPGDAAGRAPRLPQMPKLESA